MFVAWEHGACVCCPVEDELIAPGRFISDSRADHLVLGSLDRRLHAPAGHAQTWFISEPRWSLFAGEPLPGELARRGRRRRRARSSRTSTGRPRRPSSAPLTAMTRTIARGGGTGWCRSARRSGRRATLVVDEDLREVEPGCDGELLLAGPQVAPGYSQDPEKTAAAFVVPPGREEIHYRTGDRVRRPADGRAALLPRPRRSPDQGSRPPGRAGRGRGGAARGVRRRRRVAVGWPPSDSGAGGIVAFIGDPDLDAAALLGSLATRLPDYMVPRDIQLLDRLPLDANGKFDRRALRALLSSEGD